MNAACFLVGPPGVGKTTFARRLLGLAASGELPPGGYLTEKPKWTIIGNDIAAAGHYTGGTFDGADTVPYNGVEAALADWDQNIREKVALTLFDGDRFSHAKAFEFVRARVPVLVMHLAGDAELLAARRAARGSNQNASWLKGRETKARRFAQDAENDGVAVFLANATAPTDALVEQFRDLLRVGFAAPA